LVNQFIWVKDVKIEDYPKALVPFRIKAMEKFFLDFVNNLKSIFLNNFFVD